MGKVSQIKVDNRDNYGRPLENNFTGKVRLDLNDLIKQRQQERITDKKTNLMVISGAMAVVAVVVVILSL